MRMKESDMGEQIEAEKRQYEEKYKLNTIYKSWAAQ